MENKNKIFEMILYDNFTEKQGIALPDYINMINVMIDLYISQKKIYRINHNTEILDQFIYIIQQSKAINKLLIDFMMKNVDFQNNNYFTDISSINLIRSNISLTINDNNVTFFYIPYYHHASSCLIYNNQNSTYNIVLLNSGLASDSHGLNDIGNNNASILVFNDKPEHIVIEYIIVNYYYRILNFEDVDENKSYQSINSAHSQNKLILDYILNNNSLIDDVEILQLHNSIGQYKNNVKLNRENIISNKKIYYPLQNTGDCAVKTLIIPLYYLGLKYNKFENEENVLNNFLHFMNIIRLDIFNNHINIDEITDISRQQILIKIIKNILFQLNSKPLLFNVNISNLNDMVGYEMDNMYNLQELNEITNKKLLLLKRKKYKDMNTIDQINYKNFVIKNNTNNIILDSIQIPENLFINEFNRIYQLKNKVNLSSLDNILEFMDIIMSSVVINDVECPKNIYNYINIIVNNILFNLVDLKVEKKDQVYKLFNVLQYHILYHNEYSAFLLIAVKIIEFIHIQYPILQNFIMKPVCYIDIIHKYLSKKYIFRNNYNVIYNQIQSIFSTYSYNNEESYDFYLNKIVEHFSSELSEITEYIKMRLLIPQDITVKTCSHFTTFNLIKDYTNFDNLSNNFIFCIIVKDILNKIYTGNIRYNTFIFQIILNEIDGSFVYKKYPKSTSEKVITQIKYDKIASDTYSTKYTFFNENLDNYKLNVHKDVIFENDNKINFLDSVFLLSKSEKEDILQIIYNKSTYGLADKYIYSFYNNFYFNRYSFLYEYNYYDTINEMILNIYKNNISKKKIIPFIKLNYIHDNKYHYGFGKFNDDKRYKNELNSNELVFITLKVNNQINYIYSIPDNLLNDFKIFYETNINNIDLMINYVFSFFYIYYLRNNLEIFWKHFTIPVYTSLWENIYKNVNTNYIFDINYNRIGIHVDIDDIPIEESREILNKLYKDYNYFMSQILYLNYLNYQSKYEELNNLSNNFLQNDKSNYFYNRHNYTKSEYSNIVINNNYKEALDSTFYKRDENMDIDELSFINKCNKSDFFDETPFDIENQTIKEKIYCFTHIFNKIINLRNNIIFANPEFKLESDFFWDEDIKDRVKKLNMTNYISNDYTKFYYIHFIVVLDKPVIDYIDKYGIKKKKELFQKNIICPLLNFNHNLIYLDDIKNKWIKNIDSYILNLNKDIKFTYIFNNKIDLEINKIGFYNVCFYNEENDIIQKLNNFFLKFSNIKNIVYGISESNIVIICLEISHDKFFIYDLKTKNLFFDNKLIQTKNDILQNWVNFSKNMFILMDIQSKKKSLLIINQINDIEYLNIEKMNDFFGIAYYERFKKPYYTIDFTKIFCNNIINYTENQQNFDTDALIVYYFYCNVYKNLYAIDQISYIISNIFNNNEYIKRMFSVYKTSNDPFYKLQYNIIINNYLTNYNIDNIIFNKKNNINKPVITYNLIYNNNSLTNIYILGNELIYNLEYFVKSSRIHKNIDTKFEKVIVPVITSDIIIYLRNINYFRKNKDKVVNKKNYIFYIYDNKNLNIIENCYESRIISSLYTGIINNITFEFRNIKTNQIIDYSNELFIEFFVSLYNILLVNDNIKNLKVDRLISKSNVINNDKYKVYEKKTDIFQNIFICANRKLNVEDTKLELYQEYFCSDEWYDNFYHYLEDQITKNNQKVIDLIFNEININKPNKIFTINCGYQELLYMYRFNNFYKDEQKIIIERIMNTFIPIRDDVQLKIFNLPMGSGKTSVVTPLVVLRLLTYLYNNPEKKDNIYIVLPETLVKQTFKHFINNFINMFNVSVYFTIEDRKYHNKFINSIENSNNSIHIISDVSIKSGIIKDIIKLNFNKNSNFYIIDEIDTILNPITNELNFPNEDKQTINDFSITFNILSIILSIIYSFDIKYLNNYFTKSTYESQNISFNTIKSRYSHHIKEQPQFYIVNYDEKYYELINELRKWFFNSFIELLLHYIKMKINLAEEQIIELNDIILNILENKNILSASIETRERINSYKYIIYNFKIIGNELLDTILSKIDRLDYGLTSKIDSGLVVPFSCLETPIVRSQFSHPLLVLSFNIIAYSKLSTKINLLNYKNIIHINSFNNIISSNRVQVFTYYNNDIIRLLEHYNIDKNLSIDFEKDSEKVLIILKDNNLILEHLKLICSEIGYYNNMNKSFGLDIMSKSFFKNRVGFTGTPENINSWKVKDEQIEIDTVSKKNTDKINKCITKISEFAEINMNINSYNYLIEVMKYFFKKNCSVLIDVTGSLVGINEIDIIKLLKSLNTDHRFKYMIYWNKEDIACRYNLNNDIITFDYNTSIIDNKNLYYFDQKHTTGTDSKIHEDARCLCLVSDINTSYRNFVQSAWRMRGIDLNQKINVMIDKNIINKIHLNWNDLKLRNKKYKFMKWLRLNDDKKKKINNKLTEYHTILHNSKVISISNSDVSKVYNKFSYQILNDDNIFRDLDIFSQYHNNFYYDLYLKNSKLIEELKIKSKIVYKHFDNTHLLETNEEEEEEHEEEQEQEEEEELQIQLYDFDKPDHEFQFRYENFTDFVNASIQKKKMIDSEFLNVYISLEVLSSNNFFGYVIISNESRLDIYIEWEYSIFFLEAIFRENNTQNVYLFTKSLICFYSPEKIVSKELLNFITLFKIINDTKYLYSFHDFMKIYNTPNYTRQTIVFLNYSIHTKKIINIELIEQFIRTYANRDNVYCKKLFLLKFSNYNFDLAKNLCDMSNEYRFLDNCSNILLKDKGDICN
jgi:hypothetical protein